MPQEAQEGAPGVVYVHLSCAYIMLPCSNLSCQPALDGHAFDLGTTVGLKILFGDTALRL